MARYAARRIAHAALALWVVSLLVFAATQALPGDPARAILGRAATPERLAALREQLQLDRPILDQYVSWLTGILHGDLGTSLASRQSVLDFLGPRIANTLVLVIGTAIIALPLAFFLGSFMARRRDRPADHALNVLTLTLAAMPEFVVGVTLIMLFATGPWKLLPAVSAPATGRSVLGDPAVIVLPLATLTLLVLPYMTRMVRASMLEVLETDYVQQARLNGLPERAVVRRYAMLNTLAPTAQVAAVVLAYVTGGAVIVEAVFAYPGAGLALLEAARFRDLPVLQFLALGIASVYVLLYLAADLVGIAVTPKLRTTLR